MTETIKEELILKGVFCASCTPKMEKRIKALEGVIDAYVNFAASKLIIEIDSNYKSKIDFIKEESKNIAIDVEPGIKVLEKDQNNHSNGHSHSNGHDYSRGNIHSSGHDHTHDELFDKKVLTRFGIGVFLFLIAITFPFSFWIELGLYGISYILIGGEVVLRAIKNIARGQVFDENFLMALATVGAFAIKEFPEAVAVMLFYQIGELFQSVAVNRSRKSITALMDIRPDYANLKDRSDTKRVSPEDVKVSSIIVVKPGEKIPLDGDIIEGKSMVDTSALTGESVPRKVSVGDNVLGGFINKNGLLMIRVTKEFGESTVSKILDLVENASSKKAPTENFITKFAKYYTPVVVISALALAFIPPIFIEGAAFSNWLYRALVFLVISCPCALVVSIPLGFFGGIGGASKNGVLVKGGNYLEALNNIDTIVFDKTGTLTKGVFKVTQITSQTGFSEEELLEYAAYAENHSTHPIASSILEAYGKEIVQSEIGDYEEIPGHGIRAVIKDKTILTGNTKLMKSESISFEEVDAPGTVIHVAIDYQYAGYIIISDEIKEDSPSAMEALKELGIKKLVMLTGDNRKVAEKVGSILNLDEVHAELLPDQKVEQVERLDQEKPPKRTLLFVGDGINDAPVLARADVGVAMGGLGSDAAIEAADVVLMTDEPSKLVSAIKIAKHTRKIVWQNIIFSLGIKIFVLGLGAFGIATMWAAVFADVGVALLAVLNAMRVMHIKGVHSL